jgi:hypothetical protein
VSPSSIIVLERGARWFSDLTTPSVVLEAAPLEPHSSLLRRTYESIRELERDDACVAMAVLSCGMEDTDELLDFRARLARALMALVLRTREGHLILFGPQRLQKTFFGLTAALSEGLGETTASVSVVLARPSTPADPQKTPAHR